MPLLTALPASMNSQKRRALKIEKCKTAALLSTPLATDCQSNKRVTGFGVLPGGTCCHACERRFKQRHTLKLSKLFSTRRCSTC
jgi:hypothetical protein